jgi:hypothetical protein
MLEISLVVDLLLGFYEIINHQYIMKAYAVVRKPTI